MTLMIVVNHIDPLIWKKKGVTRIKALTKYSTSTSKILDIISALGKVTLIFFTSNKTFPKFLRWSCWWFRNPKNQPPGMYNNPIKNEKKTTNLNWWVYRISEPSTVPWTFQLRSALCLISRALHGSMPFWTIPTERGERTQTKCCPLWLIKTLLQRVGLYTCIIFVYIQICIYLYMYRIRTLPNTSRHPNLNKFA